MATGLRHIRLILHYDGTHYEGWQFQPGRQTIQGVLERALLTLAPDRSRLVAAGRTDAGVHSLGQVASFRTASAHPPETFRNALNAQVPPDIRVVSAQYCDADFHPRYDAKGKRYIYLIHNGPVVSPFLARFVWPLRHDLDASAMREAAGHLVGRHDFRSFQGAGCSAKSTVRNLTVLELRKARSIKFLDFSVSGSFIIISAEADAFLRYMVRNIVGTLVEVGRGARAPREMKKVLAGRDRQLSGPTAPATGLFLEKVFY